MFLGLKIYIIFRGLDAIISNFHSFGVLLNFLRLNHLRNTGLLVFLIMWQLILDILHIIQCFVQRELKIYQFSTIFNDILCSSPREVLNFSYIWRRQCYRRVVNAKPIAYRQVPTNFRYLICFYYVIYFFSVGRQNISILRK